MLKQAADNKATSNSSDTKVGSSSVIVGPNVDPLTNEVDVDLASDELTSDESASDDLEENQTPEEDPPSCDLESLRQTTIVVCLVILAMLAVGYTMYFGKAIFMPIVFALLLNFIFSPTVIALRRRGVPSAIGALLMMIAGIAMLVGLFWILFLPARSWLDKAPENISKIESKVSEIVRPFNSLKETTEKVDQLVDGSTALASEASKKAAKEKEKASDKSKDEESAEVPLKFGTPTAAEEDKISESDLQSAVAKEPPVKVQLERPSLTGFVLNATGDALLGIGLAFVLLFYLLAAGERGLEKMVELMPTFKDKKRIVGLTRDIQQSIVQYLRTTTLINIGLGLVIGTGLWLIGMPNPLLWGVMACLLNFFPMIGACIGSLIVFVIALVTFDSISFALVAPAIYGGVNLVEANFVTPTLLGRSVSLHPVWLMVFFTIVTWLWGVGGAILAVPMLAVIKISCDHSDVFQPVGKFLGR